MVVNIYSLIDPITNKVVYVGQTSKSLESRLKSHYWKLNEAKRGKRTMTKLFKFLDSRLPIYIKIELLKVVDTNAQFGNPDFYEKFYISKYKNINSDLLNETNGGIGGYTIINKSKEEKLKVFHKISIANKGRKKSDDFKEHLSAIRKGSNNPMAKKFSTKVACYKDFKLIKVFDYGYEINKFVNSVHAWGNVKKVLDGKVYSNLYGYVWKYII